MDVQELFGYVIEAYMTTSSLASTNHHILHLRPIKMLYESSIDGCPPFCNRYLHAQYHALAWMHLTQLA
eukprot:5728197-Heterocapsa_arctica.AAC.1